MCAQLEGGRCYSSYYSCYCYCLSAQQQKGDIFEQNLQCRDSQDGINFGATQPFPAEGEAIPDSCSWVSDFFLSVKCLPLPLSLTFTLCHSRETRTSSRKKIEWAGGPLEAASASPPLPKQFNSGPQLAYAAQLCKRSASSWASILRWWFKEHLLWSEHILGGFVPPSWTTYQSFPSTTFSTRSLFFNNNALKPFVNWGSAFLPIWPDI